MWQWVTDAGLETDLIFHHGVDLPEFAAYPLVWTDEGRGLLHDYYRGFGAVAETAGAGLLLETPTWRANPDWGAALGHDASTLADANGRAVELLQGIAGDWRDRVAAVEVVGVIGPRGDGYRPGEPVDPDEAADYHRPQVAALAAAGADRVTAYTLTDPGEAIGVVRAADDVGVRVAVAFTVETDGRLPDGTTLPDAIGRVDAAAAPSYHLVNCAHPIHVAGALAEPGEWRSRVEGLRCNASTLSHAELDEAEELDDGDLDLLVRTHRDLEHDLPELRIVGGCCGSDVRHVAALWGVPTPA